MQLRNVRVRTRIIGVLCPFVVVIVAMAAMGVRDRLGEAGSAAEDARAAEVVESLVAVADTHVEQALAVAAGEGETSSPAAAAARTALDAALADLGADAPLVTAAAGEVTRALATFDEAVGTGAPAELAPAAADLFDALEATAIAAVPRVRAGGADLDTTMAYLEAHDAVAQLGLTLLAADGVSADGLTAAALLGASDRLSADLDRLVAVAGDLSVDGSGTSIVDAVREGPLGPEAVADAVARGGADTDEVVAETAVHTTTLADAAAADAADQRAIVAGARDSARSGARNLALGSAIALLTALLLAVVVARSITDPLRQLISGAYEIANHRLPQLVDRLRSSAPDAVVAEAELAPIEIGSDDEIGQLAAAFNSMQKVTADVADRQAAMLRKGISDLFVNLARRNQSLLDRQIEFIDQLEAHEQDPDQLQNLFKLDHLATRMRRNAESLLVLAGADPGRRRGRPVALTDVVRVAIGEVEHFSRIGIVGLDEVQIRGSVAVDLAHVLAELMDNATNFSPPDTRVEVSGRRIGPQSYLLSITDRGIGMSERQLAEVNVLLARPPAVGLDLSRTLGLTVVARLAARHGLAARIVPAAEGQGVVAQVHLPGEVFDALAPAEPGVDAPFTRVPTAAAGALWGDGTVVRARAAATPPAATLPTAPATPAAAAPPAVEAPEAPPAVEAPEAPPAVEAPEAPVPAPEVPAAVEATAGPGGLPTRRAATAADAGDGTPAPAAVSEPTAAATPWAPRVAPAPAPADWELPTVTPDDLGFAPGSPFVASGPAVNPATPPAAATPLPARPIATAEPVVSGDHAEPDGAALAAGALPARTPRAQRMEVPPAGTGPGLATSAVTSGHRSPEEVRRMLSRYRAGLRRGQADTDGAVAHQTAGGAGGGADPGNDTTGQG